MAVMRKSVTRLFTQFQPDHYTLEIDLDESGLRFAGRVVITGRKVGRPSKRLTFHANGLKVTSGKISFHGKKGVEDRTVTRLNLQKSMHEVRLHTEGLLYPGEYTVEMTFEAPINRGMTGIYPCFFKDGTDEKKLFATQFESHHAREAFPCVDEPEAKATFDLTLTTAEGIEVLSNTPIKNQTTNSARLTTTFERTPRMSTYLLAFVTGELNRKTAHTKSGVEVSTWATVAQPVSSLNFALDVAVKSIEYFEDYFGVPYPLAKSDHVALPDFSSGAMENWGLITYRERVLLAYDGDTGQSTKEQIALVVAHETSHQWFGNLVTMRWWNDLWLNESFANMMEYQCIDSFFPEWHVWDSFVAGEGLSAFRRDATYGVQAVRTDVHHPDEISSLFDPSIVYAKGGRLLYMLKNYIGDDAFRRGLTAYFNKHAYGNTTGDDLWAALSEASGKDVGAFMTPWLTRSGFPMLTVGQEYDGDNTLIISQQQFLDDPTKADVTRVWPVPLFASATLQLRGEKQNEVEPTEIITSSQVKYSLKQSAPVLLNTASRGHYLVRYTSESTLPFIREQIRTQTLSEADRLMALNAASMFARAGYDNFASALSLLSAYENETSEPVWDMMALIVGESRRFIDLDSTLETALKKLSDELASKQIARLGWNEKPGESSADQKLRGLVISLGLYAEDQTLVKHATDMFYAAKDDAIKLPAELRGLIMVVPIRAGDDVAFEYLLDLHDATQNSDMKNDVADALTSTRSGERAERLLGRLKNADLIKPQDADRWLVSLLRNRYTRSVAWQWMVDNWDWLEETYKHDKSYDYLPRYAASCVNTAEYQQKFDDLFLSKIDQPLLKRNIELGREEIATRVAWLARDLASVQTYFKADR